MSLVIMKTLPLGVSREFFQALHLRWANNFLLETKYFKICIVLLSHGNLYSDQKNILELV